MRTDDHDGRCSVTSWQGHVEIGGIVMGDFQAKALRHPGYGRMGPLLAGAIRIAGNAWRVLPIVAKLFKQREHRLPLCVDCCLNDGGANHLG